MSLPDREDLIDALARDLKPVRTRTRHCWSGWLWWLSSWIYVVCVAVSIGPIRANALDSLQLSPLYALESIAGLLVTGLFCSLAFRESIPGITNKKTFWIAAVAVIVWLGFYFFGFFVSPALEPSMTGKRAHCVLEAFLYSGPPVLAGYYWLYRYYPLRSVRTGIYLGISAGSIPALIMQFVCMYIPAHILSHHIAPILVVAFAGGLLGYFFHPRRLNLASFG